MTDVTASAFAEALRDRYVLERELGRGGMATVYLARDVKHDRLIALKVLHPELATSVGPERFQREIRLAAGLQHSNILPVHDSGEAAGQLWYTMPFVDGESLRGRLHRERQLPISDALRITCEVADALDYAHSKGVVHRDIKPENILLSHGHALVADFGVARALQATGREQLTETGMSVGTPAYMSPEQCLADPKLDGRSDLYSLGCVLYEMLAGEAPYTGISAQAILAKRLGEPIPHIRTVRDTVPGSVDQALERVLAKTAADRFPTAKAFAEALAAPGTGIPGLDATALPEGDRKAIHAEDQGRQRVARRLLAGVMCTALVVVGFLTWRRLHSQGEGGGASRVLAVLPFENQGRPDDDYFADGLADEVRGKLTQIPTLEVIARASSGQYKKTTKQPQQIARELGARYLLTGTVRWDRTDSASSHIRVSPELIEVVGASARSRWEAPFDATMTKVFEVQAEIAERVARALDVQLNQATRTQLQAKPTQDLEAYDAYLRGLGDPALGEPELQAPQQLEQSITALERAVTLDSSFALAWSALATLRRIYAERTTRPDLLSPAKMAADRAVALDSTLPAAHLAASRVYASLNDSVRSARELAAALHFGPNDPEVIAHAALEQYVKNPEHSDSALAMLRRAEVLNPRSAAIAQSVLAIYLGSYQFRAAVAAADHLAALAPRSSGAAGVLPAAMRLLAGDTVQARRMMQAPPGEIPTADFLTGAASFYWLLTAKQQQELRGLAPEAFGNRGEWAFAQCRLARWQGDSTAARAYADSLRVATEELLRVSPTDFQLTSMHAAALAWLGRQREAQALARQIREHPGPGPQPENSDLGVMYTDIGRVDSAAKYFAAAIGKREQPGVVGMIPYAPHYAALRAYQPFQPFLRQLAAFGQAGS